MVLENVYRMLTSMGTAAEGRRRTGLHDTPTTGKRVLVLPLDGETHRRAKFKRINIRDAVCETYEIEMYMFYMNDTTETRKYVQNFALLL